MVKRESKGKSLFRRRFLVASVLAMVTSLPLPALAATFTVINTDDSGVGSLREAVASANADPDSDVIDFEAGLTGTITLTGGEIHISESVSITGPGADTLAVSGGESSRIFSASNVALIEVSISGLTIQDGSDQSHGGCIISGGVSLELDGVTVTNCSSGFNGGGVAVIGSDSMLAVTIRDSVITGSEALNWGGGLFVYGLTGTLLLDNAVITDNDVTYSGGGGGVVVALFEGGTALVQSSTISGNATNDGGGGLMVSAVFGYNNVVVIQGSTIADNTAAQVGGGIQAIGVEDLQITGSTLSGNSAGTGGGLLAAESAVLIENSTLSTNDAQSSGGALRLSSSRATLQHTTITGNTTGNGGGAVSADGTKVSIENSIIADNDTTGTELSGTNLTISHSLVKAPGTTSFTDGGGNILEQDPLLGALLPNDGPTSTHLPASDSPVIDAGDPAFTGPPATDQRGLPRVSGDALDMGAVEVTSLGNSGAGGTGAGGDTSSAGEPGDTGAAGETGSGGADTASGGDTSARSGGSSGSGGDTSSGKGGSSGSGGGSTAATRSDSEDESSCGCEVPGNPRNSSGALAVVLLTAAALGRRRRR